MIINISFIVSTVSFVIFIFSTFILVKLLKARSLILINSLLCLACYILLPLVFKQSINFFYYTSLYLFFSMSYFFFFGGVYKSISVRILIELLNAHGNSLNKNIIYKDFVIQDSYKSRLNNLEKNKFITSNKKGDLTLTAKGMILVKLLNFVQKIYKIKFKG